MADWRREIERISGGVVVSRQDLELIGLFGGSERWNREADMALRLFTMDEILQFLESGGREPKDVPLFREQRPLRTDDADYPAEEPWPCNFENFYLPIGDLRSRELPPAWKSSYCHERRKDAPLSG